MKIYNKIRGTMVTVPNIEVNTDTVYIRSNIIAINEDKFKGWEYDEVQYEIKEYIGSLTNTGDVGNIAMLLTLIMSEIDAIKVRLNKLDGGK
ncbi:hypothetical protein [Clostridium tyrobutyricum]|jgi:hypothetical protein|uniref:hypothetical protein n=1 Tax=Clostridium tyrobutyricum TaxID=1519 RepID=UPI00241D0199|nr:hypothetical protein [Clostridium tyrobutyricum]